MTHYSVRQCGEMFMVHADDSGYNVLGYSKKKRARRRAQLLNFEDALRRRLSDAAVPISPEAIKLVLDVVSEQLLGDT